jgi:sRNA-binding carbon storage regulator CsrA
MSNLILTRKKQDAVVLYKEVYEAGSLRNEVLCEIVVTSLREKQVKLAFKANNNIKIDRREVYERGE